MATLHPFRALRPKPADAARIAAVPYDVVNTDEARALADDNPLSLPARVARGTRAAAGADPYADAVYQRAAENFAALQRQRRSCVEDEPSVYFYRLRMGRHEQTGVAACFSLDEYDRDIIKKHERTRRDKEDDRTRHMLALGAQTGPVFLTYRAIGRRRSHRRRGDRDGAALRFRRRRTACSTRCGGWAAPIATRWWPRSARIPSLYIADGHHRAASAARARARSRSGCRRLAGDGRQHDAGGGVSARPGADPARTTGRQGPRRPDAGRGVPGRRCASVRVEAGPAVRPDAATSRCTSRARWHTLRPRRRA